MFIGNDEYILLSHDQRGARMTRSDLHRFRDLGISTILEYLTWAECETYEGSFDFSDIDLRIAQVKECGFKAIVALDCDYGPAFYPDDWYLHDAQGQRFQGWCYANMMSPWCPQAYDRLLLFLERATSHLSRLGNVLPIRATVHGGETMLPDSGPVYHDPWARRDIRERYGVNVNFDNFSGEQFSEWMQNVCWRMMREEQSIVVNQSLEYWTMLHHAFDTQHWTGNQFAHSIYVNLASVFRACQHSAICFTYFQDVAGKSEHVRDVQEHHMAVWVGSEYAEGWRTNTSQAIEIGFRGFVTAPLHAYSGHKVTQPWMFQAANESLTQWRTARGIYQG